ncbi:hypothetical protein SAMN05880501_115100 [Ureibacillus xyleni]|uniref:Nitroreductase domain-containing protein n=1 Tax=Ureibacillus xyleni TaxID=614648 RepID=A0A285TLX9_9BACL|nr:nitroreductase family protein [Ureibacillus xyleni]SOC23532.1 hypothetical protein SAMN05880501_115100 [Ureibacillus xyleni]
MVLLQEKVSDFYNAVKERRTYYSINNEIILTNEELEELINLSVLHAPSAFNSQGDRVVLLVGEQHTKLWDITIETLSERLPADRFATTEAKLNGFKNGYGTVLFFEDLDVSNELQEKFPTYKDNIPSWFQQNSGILQYIVWTGLEQAGYGASVQHYNPLIDEKVRKEWNIPTSWNLLAQMPFGKPIAPPKEKQYQSLDHRVKVFK